MAPLLLTYYRFFRAIVTGLKDPEFKALLYVTIVILLSGMFFYHGVEHWGYLDSFYFSVTTLTTVGYGDFVPHTVAGKIFTIIYIFVGIGIILGFIDAVARHARIRNPLRKSGKSAASIAEEKEREEIESLT